MKEYNEIMTMTETRQEEVKEKVGVGPSRKMNTEEGIAAILRASSKFSLKSAEALRGVWPELSAELKEARSRDLRRAVFSPKSAA